MLVVWFEANLSCRAFSMSQIDSLDISCMQHLVITLLYAPFPFWTHAIHFALCLTFTTLLILKTSLRIIANTRIIRKYSCVSLS